MEFLNTLTEEQRSAVELFGKSQAIIAGAGSGKTTTLVAKCRLFLAKNPKGRFCAISFTEKSAQDLKRKLSEKIPDLTPHTVTTIHGLCAKIIQDFTFESGLKGDEEVLSAFEAGSLWNKAFEQLWEKEDLAQELKEAFFHLMERESLGGIKSLISRVRECAHFGALESLQKQEDHFETKALAAVASFVIGHYEELKKARGWIDFNDLEKYALVALRNPSVQEHYHSFFDLVLVDEFQDTNALQGELISLFVKKQMQNLCVVGDPKQSIYRFRDADYSIFQNFYGQCENKHSLTFNFRSRPSILGFVNRLCEPLFQATGLSYEALQPKREETEESGVYYAHLNQPEDLVHYFKNKIRQGEDLSDTVILLRKMRGNEDWFKVLSQNKIPISIGSGGFFWEDPRVKELVYFLKWWNEPLNGFSGGVFLKSPVLGFNENHFQEWIRSGRSLWEGFWRSGHSLCSTLKPFLEKPHRPGELLLSFLKSPCAEAFEKEYGLVFIRLWHKCEELSSDGHSFSEIVTLLFQFMSEKKREAELPPPMASGQVRVFTVHGSKGLEFKNVVLLDFWNKKERAKPAPLLYWDTHHGAYLSRRDEEGERIQTKEEIFWKDLESQKELNELKRVFYVALTRAQEKLILFFPKNEPCVLKPKEDPYTLDFWRAWVEKSGLSELKKLEASCFLENETPLVIPQKKAPLEKKTDFKSQSENHRPRMSVTEWGLFHKCELSYVWTYLRPPEVKRKKEIKNSENTSESLGTLVHAALEKKDFNLILEQEKNFPMVSELIRTLQPWVENSPWMQAEREGAQRKVWSEFSFEVSVHGQTFVGTMDRVVVDRFENRDEPGRFSYEVGLIDFKVSDKKRGPAHFHENYRPAMSLYLQALKELFKGKEVESFTVHVFAISPSEVREVPFELSDLEIPQKEIQRIQELVRGREPKVSSGSFCRHCTWNQECAFSSLKQQ